MTEKATRNHAYYRHVRIYTKHSQGHQTLGIGCLPFVVDIPGRMHDDALRTIWHKKRTQLYTH